MTRAAYEAENYVSRLTHERIFWKSIEDSKNDRKAGVLFYGDGGSGKTWLFENLKSEVSEKISDKSRAGEMGFNFTYLTLDRNNDRLLDWFVSLRMNASFNVGVEPKLASHFRYFKRFDALLMLICKIEGKDYNHPKYKGLFSQREYADAIEGGLLDHLTDLLDLSKGGIASTLEITPVAPFLRIFSNLVGKKLNAASIKKFQQEFIGINSWGIDDCLERLPLFLARDFNDLWLDFPQNKTIVLIDGHDRLFSGASFDESGKLEYQIRRFFKALSTGTIVFFSQYNVDWLGIQADENPLIETDFSVDSLLEGDRNFHSFNSTHSDISNISSLGLDELLFDESVQTVSGIETTDDNHEFDYVTRVHLSGFESEEQKRELVTKLGLVRYADTPAMAAILRSTSLPFELRAKLEHLYRNGSHTSGDQKFYEQPFESIFADVMENKPREEAQLLKLVWFLSQFDRELLAKICSIFGVPINENMLQRLLSTGMFRDVETIPGQLVVEHHYKRLLAKLVLEEWSEKATKYGNRPAEQRSDELALLADALMIDLAEKRKNEPLHSLGSTVDDIMRCFKSSLAADGKPISKMSDRRRLSNLFNIHLDFIEDMLRVESLALWIGDLKALTIFAKRQISHLMDHDRSEASEYVLLLCRSCELIAKGCCTPGSSYNPDKANEVLIEAQGLLENLAGERFFVLISPSLLSYWTKRIDLVFHRLSPNWSGTRSAANRRIIGYGTSLSLTMRGLEGLSALLTNSGTGIDQLDERHHRLFYAKTISAAARQLRRANDKQAEELLQESYSCLRELLADYPSDLSVIEEFIEANPDIDDVGLSREAYLQTVDALGRYVGSGQSGNRLIYWLEKANIRLARSYIIAEEKLEGMPAEAEQVLRRNYQYLSEHAQVKEGSNFRISQLLIKSLRKTIEEYQKFQPKFSPEEFGIDVGFICEILKGAYQIIENTSISLGHPIFHESTKLASLNEVFAQRFIAVATEMVQSSTDCVRQAFWLLVVADLTAKWARHSPETVELAPAFLKAVNAIDSCTDTKHDSEGIFAKRREMLLDRLFNIQISVTRNSGIFFGASDEIISLKVALSESDIKRLIKLAMEIAQDAPGEAKRMLETYLPLLFDTSHLDLIVYGKGLMKYLSLTGKSSAFKTTRDEIILLNENLEAFPECVIGYSSLFSADKLQQVLERDSWDRATRVLASALINLDPILPVENILRQNLRKRYVEAIWQALQTNYANRRNLLATGFVSDMGDLDAFVNGTSDDFGTDLLNLLLRFKTPSRPVAGDIFVLELDQATRLNVESGTGVTGPMCFGKWGEHEVGLAPSLISVAEFHTLKSTRESDDNELSRKFLMPLEAQGAERIPIEPTLRLILSLLKPRKGRLTASQRGWEHVKGVVDLLYPGVVGNGELGSRIAMGASNSWLLAFIPSKHKSVLLKQGGWFVNMIGGLLGLRRVTLSETSTTVGDEAKEREIREFTNDSFKALKLIELTGGIAHFLIKVDGTYPRKIRTFSSMFKKLFPGVQPRISGPDELWNVFDESSEDALTFEKNLDKGFFQFSEDDFDPSEKYSLIVQKLLYRGGSVRGALLRGQSNEQILLAEDTLHETGLVLVPQQSLICSVYRDGGRYKVRNAVPQLVDEDELEEFTIIDVDRSAREFRAEAPADTSQLDINKHATASGSLELAHAAGHNELANGDVIACEVKNGVDDEPCITYIATRNSWSNLLTSHQLEVRNYSKKHDAYFLITTSLNGSVKLPRKVLTRAGYLRLYKGDLVSASIYGNRSYPQIKRILNCSRRIYRDVGVIISNEQETPKGRRWRIIVVNPNEVGCDQTPYIYLNASVLPDSLASLHLPKGAKAFVDLQQEPEGRFSVTRVVDLSQFEGGRWVLGELTLSKAGNWLFLFDVKSSTEVSLVPEKLYDKLPQAKYRANVWIKARMVRTKSGWVVCDIRSSSRTRTLLENGSLAGKTKLDVFPLSSGANWIVVEHTSGTLARVSRNMLRFVGLPDGPNVGLPITYQTVNRRGIKNVSFIEFDGARGFENVLCYLLPTRDGRNGRFLELVDNGKNVFIPKRDRNFSKICAGEPGKYFSADGYISGGKHFVINLSPEVTRIPWTYGFYKETRNEVADDARGTPSRNHVFHALGQRKEFSFPTWMIEQRGFQKFKFGEKVRFTFLTGRNGEVTPGMFEITSEDIEWLHEGFVDWYDEKNDFGKIVLLIDQAAEIRFKRAAFGDETGIELYKSMPVTFKFDRLSGKNFKAINLSRRRISRLPWMEANIKMLADDDSYGFVSVLMGDGDDRSAYIPRSICEILQGEERFTRGARIFCQVLPSRSDDFIVVNAFLGLDEELADNERIVVAEQDSSGKQPGLFVDLFTGTRIHALASAYLDEDEENISVRRDYIMHVGVREDGKNIVIDEIIRGMGVRFEYSPKL